MTVRVCARQACGRQGIAVILPRSCGRAFRVSSWGQLNPSPQFSSCQNSLHPSLLSQVVPLIFHRLILPLAPTLPSKVHRLWIPYLRQAQQRAIWTLVIEARLFLLVWLVLRPPLLTVVRSSVVSLGSSPKVVVRWFLGLVVQPGCWCWRRVWSP